MLVTVLLAAVAAAPGFTLAARTPRGDYYVLADRPKLAVEPTACDRKLAKLERMLGVRVPRFSYRRVGTPGDVVAYSRDQLYAGGVADPKLMDIVSTEPCSKHELAHLATFSMGRADAVTEEGVAAMLGGDYDWVDRWNARLYARRRGDRYADMLMRLRADTPSIAEKHDWYVLADSWMRHVRGLRGMPALTEYLRVQAAGKGASDAFRLVYGGDLAVAFDRWLYGKKGPPKQKARQR